MAEKKKSSASKKTSRTPAKKSSKPAAKKTGKTTSGTKKKTPSGNKAKKSVKKENKVSKSVLRYEIELLILITFTVISVLSLHTGATGFIGGIIKNIYLGLFGRAGFLFPYALAFSIFFAINRNLREERMKYIGGIISIFSSLLLLTTTFSYDVLSELYKLNKINLYSFNGLVESFNNGFTLNGGGIIGNLLTWSLIGFVGKLGVYIIAILLFSIGIIAMTRISITETLEKKKQQMTNRDKAKMAKQMTMKEIEGLNGAAATPVSEGGIKTPPDLGKQNAMDFGNFDSDNFIKAKTVAQAEPKLEQMPQQKSQEKTQEKPQPEIRFSGFQETATQEKEVANLQAKAKELSDAVKATERQPSDGKKAPPEEKLTAEEVKAIENTMTNASQTEVKDYVLPNTTILNKNKNTNYNTDREEVLKKARVLEETLNNFGVDAKVVQVSQGPTITMYELQPSPGVKVSKIVNLSDDIALNLAAHHVRIIAPIPGKAAVGIEVPNEKTSMVGLREMVETKDFKKSDSKLSFAVGKNISGEPVIADLSKMPHLLIAGATGSGKSVCVNTLISSILFKAKPEEVKLLMIDPKVVELSSYNGIPHLILPVVTDPKKASIALNWAVQEMTNRYQQFAEANVKDIGGFNKKVDGGYEGEKMPQIVVIIDELADLMMVAPNQVEDAICRLAQMARAAGIHLIVATQRPSVDVITGVIKANIPSRIAFAVSSQTDSRTIIDSGGAEKLLGKGDMLYYPVGESKPIRLQGPFVSEDELEKLVDFVKEQTEEVAYDQEILNGSYEKKEKQDMDEHFADAVKLVVASEQASISMLQRKFRIGYNRAARLIDDMEERGIVSESMGSKSRNVLISKEQLEELEL